MVRKTETPHLAAFDLETFALGKESSHGLAFIIDKALWVVLRHSDFVTRHFPSCAR